MTGKDILLRNAAERLALSGIAEARREARLLLGWATGRDLSGLLMLDMVNAEEHCRFEDAVARRERREPMAFITGEAGFWTLDLETGRDTLIPRADSEAVIEALIEAVPERDGPLKILDLGTGTGCLLLAALSEYPGAFGVGVDLAVPAASLAARNARRNGLGDRSAFFSGRWAQALSGCFNVVLSNPPYIESADMTSLMPEVREYEPSLALDGGADGLDEYRVLCADMPRLLHAGGIAIFEMGIGQIDEVSAIGRLNGLVEVARKSDLGGVPRALVMCWPG